MNADEVTKDARSAPDTPPSSSFAPGTSGAWLLVWGALGGFLLLSRSTPTALVLGIHADQVAHACGFGLVGFLVVRAVAPSERRASRAWALLAALSFCACAGAIDEWAQSFLVGRVASWMDWGADVAGGLVGSVAALRANWSA